MITERWLVGTDFELEVSDGDQDNITIVGMTYYYRYQRCYYDDDMRFLC